MRKLGGHLAARACNPPVLGELLAGVLLGNLPLLGYQGFQALADHPAMDVLARLGVVILLFEVGIESTLRDMLKVGLPSFLVASLGVAAPFALGWAASAWLLPAHGPLLHAFLGATLTATSVGITARVLKDLGRSQDPEARIILGAAVIDDVMGLVILSVVSGIVSGVGTGAGLDAWAIGGIVGKAVGFLVGALVAGALIAPPLFRLAARLEGGGVLLALSLSFAFLMAWASAQVGLSPIVGAYAAGLILEPVHFADWAARGKEHQLGELVAPIVAMLSPVFFVLMGMQVVLRLFAHGEVFALAGGSRWPRWRASWPADWRCQRV